jgi:plastocyanin
MKKYFLTLLIFLAFWISKGNSTMFIVNVGQGGNNFAPNNITNVHIGDTIKWMWVSGIHTTTSTTIPSGAATWDAPITSSNTTFIYKVTKAGIYNYVCTPHASFMTGSFSVVATGVEITGTNVNGYQLAQNFPNPFNPVTTIKFSIPENKSVSLKIYDINGKEIKTIVNGNMTAGEYKYELNASELASGIYFYKLESDNFVETRRMMLIK